MTGCHSCCELLKSLFRARYKTCIYHIKLPRVCARIFFSFATIFAKWFFSVPISLTLSQILSQFFFYSLAKAEFWPLPPAREFHPKLRSLFPQTWAACGFSLSYFKNFQSKLVNQAREVTPFVRSWGTCIYFFFYIINTINHTTHPLPRVINIDFTAVLSWSWSIMLQLFTWFKNSDHVFHQQ